MNKRTTLLFVITFALMPLHAQQVVEDSYTQLRVHYETPKPIFENVDYADGTYLLPTLEGYFIGGEVGSPALPMSSSLLTIPFCDRIDVIVENAVYDTVNIDKNFVSMPMQPRRLKSDTSKTVLVIDQKVYLTDSFVGCDVAMIERLGIGRDRNIARLIYSPMRINPVQKNAIICRSADITVRYLNPDRRKTEEQYRRYHNPAFSIGKTLNSLGLTAMKGASDIIRMVIVAPSELRCSRLAEFVNWKRVQGLSVDLVYYDEEGMSTNNDIENYLKGLYTNATAEEPAPVYLMLVGDNEQLRAFDSRLSQDASINLNNIDDKHVTDIYFATWAGNDRLPECYQGRLSAKDTATLTNILNKTLYYETYSMADDSYLANAVLISGVDNGGNSDSYDNAWRVSDPTMDYVAKYYINSNNGYNNVSYYKNNTNFAPAGVTPTGSSQSSSTPATLKTLYNKGAGWINYSAHGEWDHWYKPQLTVSDINSMTNVNKPSFVIGNCCLTSKFDKPTCMAEAWLQRGENAGAVAYIGGTNSTIWYEDFYWSVGVRSNIYNRMDATYNGSLLGMYDRLFHTHREPFASRSITAGSILVAGNMSVNNSESISSYDGGNADIIQYYWEIYELMGDPSLMPWLGTADSLPFVADTSMEVVRIKTAPYAYVAIVDSATLKVKSAAFADSLGLVRLEKPGEGLHNYFYTATAQGYRPYQSIVANTKVGLELDLTLYPNPASTYCVVEGTKMKSILVSNIYGSIIRSIDVDDASYYIVDLKDLVPGMYLITVLSEAGYKTKQVLVMGR